MAASSAASLPWVEKYRPATIDEVAQQEEVCSALRSSLQTGELPNLMFYGPPGTGKTTVALALVQQHFGSSWRDRVKELNASDDRGISAVREKVKTFAQLALGSTKESLASSKANFRVVILDEADSMTHDAQAALRRIMDEYVSKIIEPLHSRCSKFRFSPITVEFQKERILHIAKCEGVKMGPGAIETLTRLSQGDMRCAVTMLQTAVGFYGEGAVTEEALLEVACAVPDNLLMELMSRTKQAANSDQVVQLVRGFLQEGYSGLQVMERLLDIITQDNSLTDLKKAQCATLFSAVEERLVSGCDEELQMFYLFSAFRPLLQ